MGTGKCANVNEFEKYAVTVENLSIPEQAKIVAFGENIEFFQEAIVCGHLQQNFMTR